MQLTIPGVSNVSSAAALFLLTHRLALQEQLGVPAGTIKATVLIETLPAAFEMDEILYELRQVRIVP